MAKIKILLYLSLVILSYEQLCITGKNCPLDQGDCVADVCKCKNGFTNLIDKSIPVDQQIYCNYAQTSHFKVLILELCGLGIGHFSIGNYWIGLLKLLLGITFLVTQYLYYGNFEFPAIIQKIIELFVEQAISGGFRSEKEEEHAIGKLINKLSNCLWSIVYVIDFLLLLFNFYSDGNGIPLL